MGQGKDDPVIARKAGRQNGPTLVWPRLTAPHPYPGTPECHPTQPHQDEGRGHFSLVPCDLAQALPTCPTQQVTWSCLSTAYSLPGFMAGVRVSGTQTYTGSFQVHRF